ncbi:hypothetical protein VZQ01_23095 [Myxococcus faecalis]|jgi:hypothetical protein|uniref:hypothetical protein n=1 Tax=Myxococcus TaxID=32 RepID=UPI001CBC4C46|nr:MULTISPECIES: hypothetical protein [unclassified Myxococcus]MBZ4396611.1 hypothetical protein [Myxococcus sp. AS-1-15]MBZ4411682.1 hypothetical protein [Myxococcus sp. XM-1-1-1]BDT38126.1 hypothetical protein MFMH1_77950 [Myxococcus sp. MH1]
MPFFIPFAVGGLVLTALGLGAKKVWDQGRVVESPALAQARERHAAALGALKSARLRVRTGLASYGERQARARAEVVEPLRGLLARLERWEHAKREDVLPPEALAALEALPSEPVSRAARRAWPLLGAGAPVPPGWEPVLTWMERGWLQEDAAPVVVDGVSLFEAAAPWASASTVEDTDEARVRQLDACAATLRQATEFLDALLGRLTSLETRVGALQSRAEVQLAYLDAASFEQDGPEPRERLGRLGLLVGRLVVLLRAPVLGPDGRLEPEPPVSPEEAALAQT